MKRTQPSKKTRAGFALVVALSLMAFVLLLLLFMTSLIRVEIVNSSNALAQLRAKESARLALMIALGDLQRYAGPDQRVTARAEILGSMRTHQNPYWTGTWDTTNPSAAPYWLVSWQNQSSAPNNRTYTVVGSGSVSDSAEYVTAPIIEISNATGSEKSELAWWVCDEGIKASVALVDESNEVAGGFFTDYSSDGLNISEQRQIMRQMSARRHATERLHGDAHFIPSAVEDIRNVAVADKIEVALAQLGKLETTGQLPVLVGITDKELNDGFHHLTANAKAVLSNTNTGGLKLDLSDRSYTSLAAGLPIDATVSDFLWNSLPNSNAEIPLKGLTQTEVDQTIDGEAIHTTPAIITEFSLYFAVSGERVNSTTARAFLRFEAEVWSPYGFRHAFTGASSSQTPELYVEFESLPDIQLRFYDKDTEAFTSSTTLTFGQISPRFELDLTETHKAGEIRRSVATWPANASSNPSNFYYTDQWSWSITDPIYNVNHRRVSFPEGDSINYNSSSSEITIVIKNSAGEILQRIENIPIGSIDTDHAYYEDSPSGLGTGDAPIVFRYKMKDSKDHLKLWLTRVDPRSLLLDISEAPLSELVDVNDVNGDDLGDADIPNPDFSNLDFFHGQPNNNFFRIFDLPASPPFSLGILQHLQVKGNAPFSIGNAWGGVLNNVFDRFFISGIPSSPTATYWNPALNADARRLPNPFVEVLAKSQTGPNPAALNDAHTAPHLLLNGAFNVNSTSPAAWAAVLSANSLYDWDYHFNRGTSSMLHSHRLNLENVFFRLPFSGHILSRSFTNWKFPFEDYEQESDPGDDYPYLDDMEKELVFRNTNGFNPNADWRPSFAIGHREISMPEIQLLANNLAANIESRNRPFSSLEEFLNSGIIQESINQTSINTIVDGAGYDSAADDEKLPVNATSYLSQADILTSVGTAWTARSDTFRIRAIARSIDPATGSVITSANCEAVVQRLPERMDLNGAQVMDNATGFGRKFEIKHIQWLESSQL